jgi:hypothetical protein
MRTQELVLQVIRQRTEMPTIHHHYTLVRSYLTIAIMNDNLDEPPFNTTGHSGPQGGAVYPNQPYPLASDQLCLPQQPNHPNFNFTQATHGPQHNYFSQPQIPGAFRT